MENDDPDKSSSAAILAKVDSTLVAWLVFLVFGGGIISLYYAEIRYLPDIEWSSSIVHLAVATFVGGAITLLLAASLLMPGYIWSEFLIFDEKLYKAFCFSNSKDLCLVTLGWYVGLPFWLVLVANHLALILFHCLLPKAWFDGWGLIFVYALFSLVLLLIVVFNIKDCFRDLLKKAREREQEQREQEQREQKQLERPTDTERNQPETKQSETKGEDDRRVFKYVAWFGLSVVLGQTSMLLFFLLLGRQIGGRYIAITITCVLAVLVSNHFVALHYHRSHLQAISAALMAALLLLVVADRNESFSTQVLSFYGIGERSQPLDLLLNDEGQNIIDELQLWGTCKDSPPKKICKVRVLSRLGNEYYLDHDGRKFTLPKTAVVSRTPSH